MPYVVGDKETPLISGSVGVSIYPDNATDIDGLLSASDAAMYKAKIDGRNNCFHYNQELGDKISKQAVLGSELSHAISKNQLELYYQPQLACDTYQLSGMEALLRWKHPQYGMVSPAEFIPIAEETGLISSIGTWVLETACEQIKAWNNQGYTTPRVSINLSVLQLKDEQSEAVAHSLLLLLLLLYSCLL